jgi:hypothetical protein
VSESGPFGTRIDPYDPGVVPMTRHCRQPSQTVVGQVARDEQAIGGVGNPSEERLEHALRGASAVQVTYRGDVDDVFGHRSGG